MPGKEKADPYFHDETKLTGEVVELNRSEKSLDIRTTGGAINHVHLDVEPQGSLKNIKTGDRIEVTLTIEAAEIRKE